MIPPKEIARCNGDLADIYDDEVRYHYVKGDMDDETMKELTGIIAELKGEAWLQRLKISVLEGAKRV